MNPCDNLMASSKSSASSTEFGRKMLQRFPQFSAGEPDIVLIGTYSDTSEARKSSPLPVRTRDLMTGSWLYSYVLLRDHPNPKREESRMRQRIKLTPCPDDLNHNI